MSQPSGFNPNASNEQKVQNYFVNKNWVTVDQRGITLHTYNRSDPTQSVVSDSRPFSMRANNPIATQPIVMPYKSDEQPLCEQYKCADSCSKDCNKMNCFKRPHLKK